MQGLLLVLAPTMAIEGQVLEAHSRWTQDGSRIVTEATVRAPGGDIVVSQLGGSVDGLTMRVFDGTDTEILAPGMRVALAAHPDLDLAQRPHNVVDSVKVIYTPPQFVRTGPTKAGNYLYWESGCVYVTLDSEGTKEIAGEAESAIVDQVLQTWNTGVAGCSYMNLIKEPSRPVEVGKDRVNIIKFRDTSWCRPAVDDDPARCYSAAAAGLTTAVFVDDAGSDRDGAIVDADIELNGKDFAISAEGMTLGMAGCKADLANTLTHEVGHLLGLEHTCRAGGDPPRVDNAGGQVPTCSQTSDPAITEATMYNFQDCGETKKSSLSPDDTTAICTIYPIAKDPRSCDHVSEPGGCGCSSNGPALPSVLVSALTFAWLVGRRRKNSASA
jgi:uncharacterized protein (TIGR03382 family)